MICGGRAWGAGHGGLAVLAACLLLCGGCDGCRRAGPADAGKDKDQDKLTVPDFESSELNVLPTDGVLAAYGVKPGHWYSVRQQLKANKLDFDGLLETETADRERVPYRLSNSPFQLRSRRPASLPKGQGKSFELTYLVPHTAARGRQVWLYSELQTRYGGGLRQLQSQVTNRLQPYQDYFVVLARNPDQYSYTKTLESIRPPTSEMNLGNTPGDYVVVLPPPGSAPPIPAWSLMWTSIAYVVWDDYDVSALSRDQQRSLVDWLHWGGQLVVSGPSSLENLRTSFLGEYLPADAAETRVATDQQIAELNSFWSVPSKNPRVQPQLSLAGDAKLETLRLKLRPEGRFVEGTAELVAERRVGRGNIVVAGFSLTRRELTNWRSFDNFFNACLLRRPPRKYDFRLDTGLTGQWSDSVVRRLTRRPASSANDIISELSLGPTFAAEEDAAELEGRRLPNESLITSRLRYFTRDASGPALSDGPEQAAATLQGWEGFACDAHAGIAGWNDFSACGELARAALTAAAGISVPNRSLIIMALGVYLFVLVPANWTIFRALGRLEWAWLAVPLIALVGTVAVVRLAQLDIGFARSRTEISVVELQGDYPRAHVTRYIGLYTSLSTDYRLSFADDSALAAPLASNQPRGTAVLDQPRTAILERTGKRDAAVQLQGLSVSSNSTEMVHSEQMLELEGGLTFQQRSSGVTELTNGSAYDLFQVVVLRRRRGQLEFAGFRLLPAGATSRVSFRRLADNQLTSAWNELGVPPGAAVPEGLKAANFVSLAASPARLAEGDVRLVAWNNAMLPELTIEPAASQRSFWNLWVANLRCGPLPAPRSDVNAPSDFRVEESDDRID